jgi:hypothetical protein
MKVLMLADDLLAHVDAAFGASPNRDAAARTTLPARARLDGGF